MRKGIDGRRVTEGGRNSSMVMGSSQIWSPWIIDDIHAKAELGRYRIRGFSSFQKVTHFDDLTFLSTGLTRFPSGGL